MGERFRAIGNAPTYCHLCEDCFALVPPEEAKHYVSVEEIAPGGVTLDVSRTCDECGNVIDDTLPAQGHKTSPIACDKITFSVSPKLKEYFDQEPNPTARGWLKFSGLLK